MDGLVVYVLILGGVLIVSLLNPFGGLLAYLGVLYLRPQELVPEMADMNVTRSAAIVLLLAVGLWMIRGGARTASPRAMRPLLAFLGVILASFPVGYWGYAYEVFEAMAKNLIAFWLIVTLANTEARVRRLLWALLLFQGIMAADTMYAYLTLPEEADLLYNPLGAFARGYFGGAGDFAAMTTILVPFALLFFFGERGLKRVLAVVALVVLVGGVVATHARGAGVIALVVALVASAALAARKARGAWRAAPLVACAVLAGILTLAPQEYLQRVASIGNYQNEWTAESRREFWIVGLRMFLSNPILGVGAGQYSANFHAYGGDPYMGWRVSHNMFVDVFSQLGIMGALSFGWLLAEVVRGIWRARSALNPNDPRERFLYALSTAALGSLITYFTAGMFQSILYYPMLYVQMAIAVATAQLVGRRPPAPAAARVREGVAACPVSA